MRGERLHGSLCLRVEVVPVWAPGRGEVLLANAYSGLCVMTCPLFRAGVDGTRL